jgi:uncharacterized membrane protein YraQ (UPF0718 family)
MEAAMNFSYAMLVESINMFVFLAVELTVLFLAISYAVGILQSKLPPERIQKILSDKHGYGYVAAGILGAITPFCSCSTIPFLKGLLRAEAGFGTMLVFLFASPLLNPIIIGLFAVTFGLKVTVFYFAVAMGVSVLGGIILEKLGFEKYVKPQSYSKPDMEGCGAGCGTKPESVSIWKANWLSTWSDFKTVLPYLIGGIAIGSLIYGFMPTEYVARVASESNPFAIPIAAVIGIPLYIRAEAVIPLSAALAAKGMGLGAVMALIIGSAGASLTEVVLLKSIFKNQMIAAFLIVILGMAIGAGFMYSFLF